MRDPQVDRTRTVLVPRSDFCLYDNYLTRSQETLNERVPILTSGISPIPDDDIKIPPETLRKNSLKVRNHSDKGTPLRNIAIFHLSVQ